MNKGNKLLEDNPESAPETAVSPDVSEPETTAGAPTTGDASPGEAEKPPEPVWKKILKFILRFGVSAGILTYIICTRDIEWKDFKLVKPWCIVASFFCIYTQLSLTAVRWYTLLRAAGVRCSFWEAFSLQLQGMFFSQFLPGGSVGGDVVKAGILATRTPPGGKFNVVFSIFVDRLCGLGALLIALLGTCLICHNIIAQFPEGQRNGLLVMCAVCGCLLCVVIFVFFSDLLYKVKFFKFFLDIADRITKDTFKRAAAAVALYRRSWKLLLGWIVATTLVFFPVLGMPVWLMANGFEEVQESAPAADPPGTNASESVELAQESAPDSDAEQVAQESAADPPGTNASESVELAQESAPAADQPGANASESVELAQESVPAADPPGTNVSESVELAQESAPDSDADRIAQESEDVKVKTGPKRTFLSCLMISNVSQTIAAIPGSFGGTGTRDIATAEMMTAMGFSRKESGVIPLLITMTTLLVALSCSVFFVFDRGKRARKQ